MMRYSLYMIPLQRVTDKATAPVIEGAYATVGLVSLMHDFIYAQSARDKLVVAHAHTNSGARAPERGRAHLSAALDGLHGMPRKADDTLACALSGVTCVELFLEMAAAARAKNRSGKWQTIFVIEVVKAFLRLLLLIKNGGGMVIRAQSVIPSRAELVSAVESATRKQRPRRDGD